MKKKHLLTILKSLFLFRFSLLSQAHDFAPASYSFHASSIYSSSYFPYFLFFPFVFCFIHCFFFSSFFLQNVNPWKFHGCWALRYHPGSCKYTDVPKIISWSLILQKPPTLFTICLGAETQSSIEILSCATSIAIRCADICRYRMLHGIMSLHNVL